MNTTNQTTNTQVSNEEVKDINLIEITGNLGADPEMAKMPSGETVATFRVAVNEGEGDQRTTVWHTVKAFGAAADKIVGEYLTKGRLVRISGKLKTYDYENKQGETVQANQIHMKNIRMLDKAPVALAA